MLDSLLQFLITGVTVGSTYALVGLGFAIIYNASDVVNFAQGEFVMIGAMVAISLLGAGTPFPLALLRCGWQYAPGLMRTTFRPATWCYLRRCAWQTIKRGFAMRRCCVTGLLQPTASTRLQSCLRNSLPRWPRYRASCDCASPPRPDQKARG